MGYLPHVVAAEYRGGYRIHLSFSDGREKTVDLASLLEGPIFEPVRAPGYFGQFFLDGGAVAWPNGADVAPEALYEAAAVEEAA
jgi:hypothetical protein